MATCGLCPERALRLCPICKYAVCSKKCLTEHFELCVERVDFETLEAVDATRSSPDPLQAQPNLSSSESSGEYNVANAPSEEHTYEKIDNTSSSSEHSYESIGSSK